MFVRPAARSRGIAGRAPDGARRGGAVVGVPQGAPRHRPQAGPRRTPLPAGRLCARRALQRQPVCQFLGGEGPGPAAAVRQRTAAYAAAAGVSGPAGRLWSAAQTMGICRGSRPQATRRVSRRSGIATRPGVERHLQIGREHRAEQGHARRGGPRRPAEQSDRADKLHQPTEIDQVVMVPVGDGARHDRGKRLRDGRGGRCRWRRTSQPGHWGLGGGACARGGLYLRLVMGASVEWGRWGRARRGRREHPGDDRRWRELPVGPRADGGPLRHPLPGRHASGAPGHRPGPAAEDGGAGPQVDRRAGGPGDGGGHHRPEGRRWTGPTSSSSASPPAGSAPWRSISTCRPPTASSRRWGTASGRGVSTGPCAISRCWSASVAPWRRSAPTPGSSTSRIP